MLSLPEPDERGGEAEHERHRQFRAAELRGSRAESTSGGCIGLSLTVRHLRCHDSVGVDHLDREYRSRQQVATDESNECALWKAHAAFYYVGERAKSQTALCLRGLDDVYVVMGEKRDLPGGKSGYLIKAYVNPWVRLIFLGPLIMAIGGAISLSDRRLRIGLARKAQPRPRQPEEAPA